MTNLTYDRITLRPWERSFFFRIGRTNTPHIYFILIRLWFWEWRVWR